MKSFFRTLGFPEVYTEIMIEAEPDWVWSVITDAENYKNWNPVIINAAGTYGQMKKSRILLLRQGKNKSQSSQRL